jgi:HD-like signal output (HDOD) protein
MQQLNWSAYRLAQEIIRLRQERGEEIPTMPGMQNALRKVLKEPETKSQQMNDDIITALGGEVVIRWTTQQEVKL